jgi:dihydrofolate reductase
MGSPGEALTPGGRLTLRVPRMRKIIAYLATSADGFIARPNGSVEWLDRKHPPGAYGMPRFYCSVDTVIMGRKTWESGRRLGQPLYPGKINYVLSRTRRRSAMEGITFLRGSVRRIAAGLRRAGGRDIWLVGGAEVFGAFLDAGELDQLIVHVVPVLIGVGIPLLAPRRREVPLRLPSSRRFSDGVVLLQYVISGA